MLACMMLFSIVCTLPLFATAIEWNRWLHIHLMAWIVLSAFVLSEDERIKDSCSSALLGFARGSESAPENGYDFILIRRQDQDRPSNPATDRRERKRASVRKPYHLHSRVRLS